MRILVPLEGNDLEYDILRQARDLAIRNRAELILLRVVSTRSLEMPMATPWARTQQDAQANALRVIARGALERIADKLRAARLTVSTTVYVGEPVEAILRCARAICVDLIVMPAQGLRDGEVWPDRQVTERVLRHSPVPVSVVGGLVPIPGLAETLGQRHMPN